MTVEFYVGDVFDRLAELDDDSVDLVVTSPPFLALRSYLPADHPDKDKEIGSEATPAEFIDTMLRLSAEWRRVLAPHGSLCVELGDTYAGSGGAGGDYLEQGLRQNAPPWRGSASRAAVQGQGAAYNGGAGWPLPKSKALIPQLYEIALAYGINPLTGTESPAGKWRVRNVVTWARPNPPVGALGDKWRPATSDIVVACTSGKRYWDDLATRRPSQVVMGRNVPGNNTKGSDSLSYRFDERVDSNPHGAPLLDYWEIPPGGYPGSHYAVYPPEVVVPLVKAMCPQKVCRECGEPSRREVDIEYSEGAVLGFTSDNGSGRGGHQGIPRPDRIHKNERWTDCGHDNYRPGLVLDPFAGSGTTLAVAHGHGHDAIGIDLDERNADLARDRVGPFFLEVKK